MAILILGKYGKTDKALYRLLKGHFSEILHNDKHAYAVVPPFPYICSKILTLFRLAKNQKAVDYPATEKLSSGSSIIHTTGY